MSALVSRIPGRVELPGAATGPGRAVYLWDVSLHLVRREFAARHRDALLGWLWAIAPPLLQLVVTNFLFTKIIPLGVKNYPVFLLAGILTWSWFARSLSYASMSLEASRDLVRRPGFPTGVLPLVAVLIGLVDYLLALPILLVTLVATSGLHWSALLLPGLLAIQLVFATGIAWTIAPLQVFFRDVAHMTGIVTMLGYWVTPVFYRQGQVPGRFHLIYELNPMAHLIEAQRSVLLDGSLPAASPLLAVAGAAIVVAAGGYAVFRSLRDLVPDQL